MTSEVSRYKKVPETNTNIFAHIQYNKRIVAAKIISLSCWGATIYMDDKLPINEPFIIRFIYVLDYVLHAKIIYRISEHEFRIEFIFTDWHQRETLRRDIK